MTSHGENLRASLREVQRFLETVMSNQIKSSKSNVTHWEQFLAPKILQNLPALHVSLASHKSNDFSLLK